MSGRENRIVAKRLLNAHLTSVLSMALVLFVLALMALLLTSAGRIADQLKERTKVSLVLKEEVEEDEARSLQESLADQPFVRTTDFVSRQQGLEEMRQILGDDFLEAFPGMPLPLSVDVFLQAAYVQPDSLERVLAQVGGYSEVDEVVCRAPQIGAMSGNLRKISFAAAALALVLLLISVALISNTVRLSVYARRFTVHTMRLVGATQAYIRRPFLVQSIIQGLYASLLALLVLEGVLLLLRQKAPAFFSLLTPQSFWLSAAGVVAAGVLISLVCTFFTVGRVTRLDKDELYY